MEAALSAPWVPPNNPLPLLHMAAPPRKDSVHSARESLDVNALRSQLIEDGIVCTAIYNDGMRMQLLYHLADANFENRAVFKLPQTAGNGTDCNNAVVRDAVPAVTPGFFGAPTHIVDDRDSLTCDPETESPHAISIVNLDRFGEIDIGGEVGSDDACKVTDNLQSFSFIRPHSPLSLFLML